LGRPFGKHIDDNELNALVPWSSETASEPYRLSAEAINEVNRHLEACEDCRQKVTKYRRVVNHFANVTIPEAAPRMAGCPDSKDVDWHELAAGLWPEVKAKQLILHAALCDHCGPLLRAATSVDARPSLAEQKVAAGSKASRGVARVPLSQWRLMRWLVPAAAMMLMVGLIGQITSPSHTALSGSKFVEFAVATHKQHSEGRLSLEFQSDSPRAINDWFKAKSNFSVVLPLSPVPAAENPPYRLEGARLVQVGGKTAAFIAYRVQTTQLQTDAASLMVTPASVAVASGGVEVDFKKVSFHYARVQGYKVVTWSVHGLTYALVSQEDNRTQRSCMVCHSAMGDRDLRPAPTPLHREQTAVEPVWQ